MSETENLNEIQKLERNDFCALHTGSWRKSSDKQKPGQPYKTETQFIMSTINRSVQKLSRDAYVANNTTHEAINSDATDEDTEEKGERTNDTEDITPSRTTTVVLPLKIHSHTMIFLHGREDFGEDLAESFFDSKALNASSLADIFPTARFVFPTSKMRYSAQRDFEFSSSSFAEALRGEEVISQWFDLWDINRLYYRQELMIPGLRESIHKVIEIIAKESQLVPLENIILGGISQGCATAFLALLSSKLDLGGFIGLCSFLPFQNSIEEWASSAGGDKNEISRCIDNILVDNILEITKPEDTFEVDKTRRHQISLQQR